MATDCHFSDTRALINGEDVIIMVKIEGGGEGGRSRRDGTVVVLEFLPAATQVYMLVGFHRQTNSLFGQQLIHWFHMTNVTTCDKCDLM